MIRVAHASTPRFTLEPHLEVSPVKAPRCDETVEPLREIEKPKTQTGVAPKLLRMDGFVSQKLRGLIASYDQNHFAPRLRNRFETERRKRVYLVDGWTRAGASAQPCLQEVRESATCERRQEGTPEEVLEPTRKYKEKKNPSKHNHKRLASIPPRNLRSTSANFLCGTLTARPASVSLCEAASFSRASFLGLAVGFTNIRKDTRFLGALQLAELMVDAVNYDVKPV